MSDPWGLVGGWCSVSNACIEHVLCVRHGLSGEHLSHGAVLRKIQTEGRRRKYSEQENKRSTDLSGTQCQFNLVETEPGSGHAAASQISSFIPSAKLFSFLMIIHSRNPPAV